SQVHHAAHRIQFHALGPFDAMFGGKVVEAHDAEHSVSKLFRHYPIPNFVGDREPNRVEPPAPLTQLTRHASLPPFFAGECLSAAIALSGVKSAITPHPASWQEPHATRSPQILLQPNS